MHLTPRRTKTAAFLFAVTAPAPVFAYMGPDIGFDAVRAAIGIVLLLLLAMLSVVWYPLKRAIRRLRSRPTHRQRTLR